MLRVASNSALLIQNFESEKKLKNLGIVQPK